MRKFFAVALGSMVALVGFASLANASATIDLIWIDITNVDTGGSPICLRPAQRNCPLDPRSTDGVSINSVAVTDNITLGIIITAGGQGLLAAGVGVNYMDAIPKVSVDSFRSLLTTKPGPYFTGNLGTEPNDLTAGWVDSFIAASAPFANDGIGLPAGQTAYLGTVTFHKDQLVSGTSEFVVSPNGPDGVDDIIRLDGANISGTSTFNSAFLVNVPEPGALSLLVMGLGGMLLAGRGRRS